LIPPDKKDDDDDDDQENKPNKGDEIKFDGKDEKGKQQTLVATRQSADTWMRAIQTSPTDLLARQFQLQHQQPKAAPASPTAPAAARK
jgi:Ca-activated chloride channel family protein